MIVEELTDRPIGRYVVEVFFDEKRTVKGPNLNGIAVFDRGNYPTMESTQLMLAWCGSADLFDEHEHLVRAGQPGCLRVITDQFSSGKTSVCPHCNRKIKHSAATTFRIGRTTTQALAEQLETVVRDLAFDADILVYGTPLNQRSLVDSKKPVPVDQLDGKPSVVYTMPRLRKDLANGADLRKRLEAFLQV